MNETLQFVMRHGYSILFAAIFAHQIGIPLPGPLFLLAAGALSASGKFDLSVSVTLAVAACVLADWPWYEAGRHRGMRILHFIHRLSRDPDKHDRRAKETFARYGPSILLVSKFIPGLDAVAPPLAGTAHTSRLRFLAFDAVGASLYSCAYVGLGFVFSHDLEHVVAKMQRVGTALAVLVAGAVCIFAVTKLLQRYSSMWVPEVAQVVDPVAMSEAAKLQTQQPNEHVVEIEERSKW